MGDPAGPDGSTPGSRVTLEWGPASTQRVLKEFLSSVLRDLTRPPPSKTEVVNITAIMEEFSAHTTTTPQTPTPTLFFSRPETPDTLAVGVQGSWTVIIMAALLIGRCVTTTPRGAHTPTPTLLYAHGVRTLVLLMLTLTLAGACGEAGLRYYYSQEAAHFLLLPAHGLALTTTALTWTLYHCLEGWQCAGGVGVCLTVWVCGVGVSGVRAWQAVGVNGVPPLLVYPSLCVAAGVLQLLLCCLDVAALLHRVHTQRHTQVLEITPGKGEGCGAAGVGGVGVNGGSLFYRHPHVGLPSRATFTWYLHLLRLGWRKPLGYCDLARLPREEEARYQHERLLQYYLREQNRLGDGRSPSLWRVFALTYWREMVLGGLFKLLGDSVNVVGPLAISLIVNFVTQVQEGTLVKEGVVVNQMYYVGWTEAARNGWVVAGVALVAALAQSTFSQTSTHLVAMEGIHAKAALQVMIYNKTLRLPSSSSPASPPDRDPHSSGKVGEEKTVPGERGGEGRGGGGSGPGGREPGGAGESGQDAGAIINLTSEDADNILTFFMHCHYVWAIPLKVAVIMVLLWVQLGFSALVASLAAILLLIPLQFLLCRRIADTNKTFLAVSDERLRRTCEVLAAARVVKVHGWEEVFLRKITSVRKKELALLHRDSLLRAFMTFLTQAAGVLVSLVTFGLYTLVEDKPLEAGRVFSGLALFNQLTVPLFILPIILSHTIRAKNSVRRLESFFRTPDVEGPQTPLTPITLRTRRGGGSGCLGERRASGAAGGKGGKAGGREGNEAERQDSKASRLSRVTEESRPTSACSLVSSSVSREEEDDEDDDDDDEDDDTSEEKDKSEAFKTPAQGSNSSSSRSSSSSSKEVEAECWRKKGDGLGGSGERRQLAVTIQCGTFAWPPSGRFPALEDITVQIPTGGLTVVLGGVGAGKTSFLLALLGELCTVRGQLRWFGEMSVAYAPQQPWLQNASLRDNILFGRRYLANRYRRVLDACALHPDVAILPQGDLTEIGERGISLSGGQRQRVALARALYSDARTVILDSPFAALDSGVAGRVWEVGVLGLLLGRRRTVILATHLTNFSRRAHKIIHLEGGRISVQGSPLEVARAAPKLWQEWGGRGEGRKAQDTAETIGGEGRTARERWALVRLVSRLALRHSSTRGSRRGSSDEHSLEDHEDYLGSTGHSRASRQYSMNREIPHSALLPGDEYVYLPPSLTPLLPPHPFLHPASSTASTSYKLQLFRIRSSAPAFGRKSSQVERVRQVPRHALSLPPQPRPPPSRSRTNTQPLLSRLLSSASLSRSVRRSSNTHSEKWNIGRLFTPSAALEEDLELEEEVPIEEEVEEDGKLEEEEEEERGRSISSTWNYLVYLRACGVGFGLAYLLCALLGQGVSVVLDFWLGRWTEEAGRWNETTPGQESSQEAIQENQMASYYHIYLSLSAVSVLLSLSTNLLGQVAAGRGRRSLHHRMLRALVKAAPRFLDDTPAGRLLNRVTTDTAMIDKELARSVTHLLFFVLLVTSAVLVNAIVTPTFLVAALPICLIYYAVQKFFRCSSRELKRLESLSRSPLLSHLGESLDGASVVRAYGQERRFQQVFLHRLDTHLAAFILLHAGNRWLGICLDYIGGIIVFCATTASLLGSATGLMPRLTPDMVGLAINYTLLVPVYLNWVVRFLADTEMGVCAVERVHHYASLPAEEDDDQHNEEEEEEEEEDEGEQKNIKNNSIYADDTETAQRYRRRPSQVSFKSWMSGHISSGLPPGWPLEGQVEFRDVTLKHHPGHPVVLSGVSFVIKPGEKVGVCGRTGSGKSTLALALLRVVRVTRGSVLIDGTDLRHVPLHLLRASTSLIPQDSHLFCGSIRFNCDPLGQATEAQVWRALEAVQLKDLVSALPNGLDSEVVEGGANFSVGQRQLFCVARALLRRSSLLILDEATSALDPPTEAALHHALTHAAAHATVITIAHGRKNLMTLPRVLVLENGRLTEDGNPRVLSQKPDGAFVRLLSSTSDPADVLKANDNRHLDTSGRRMV